MRADRLLPRPFFLSFLLLFVPWVVAAELGPVREPGEMRAGGLLIQTDEGLREAPLLHTDVAIEVAGLIARTRVTQRFTNPTTGWVEGIYVFPLPEDAAVDSLIMRIGERVIEGRVEERARAKQTYERAKSEGRKASLVEQERPNVFTTSLANLGPHETLEVTIAFQEDARFDRGRFSLRFPLVVGPRYIPGTPIANGFSRTGWGVNTAEVPDSAWITPPVTQRGPGRKNPVSVRAEIDAGFPLESVSSPSHPLVVRAQRGDVYAVRLDDPDAQADRDFVLEWIPTVGNAPNAALFREEVDGDEYALLMVMPPQTEATSARVSREMVIVIDTSGSMAGESIIQARRAVREALATLRPEDAFNVIEFDSSFRRLFPDSQSATAEAIAIANAWVAALEAEGGTNMLPALESALQPGIESRAVRQVVFITDGGVGNERALFSSIEQNLGRSRLYTVGIGSAPNGHFMTKAAQYGRGTFTYIGHPAEVVPKMTALFEKIDSPVLHDLRIDWGEGGVEMWPTRIPDVYAGEPVVVAARLPKAAKKVVVSGKRGGETVRLELALGGGADHEGVSRLWARRKVAGLRDSLRSGRSIDDVSAEVAAIGVRHQLVTRWSSLVAVDMTPTAPLDVAPKTRNVPSLLPKGWDFLKVFGGRKRPEARKTTLTPVAASPRDTDAQSAGVAIGQPLAQVQIGRLPQGGTPATLLIGLGASGVGLGASLLALARRRREDRSEART
ncbi:MAG: marine proteobacterial sortase target protein [Deltaproteobacteria bacterium]|nr:marine proteobacterial sortase target protein [Deltaproteobacteria bacterium]